MKKKWLQIIGYTLLIASIAFIAVLIYLGYAASKQYALQPWHEAPKWEDRLIQDKADFASYLAEERALIDSICADVLVEETSTYNRYGKNNPSSPYWNGENGNASFEYRPQDGEIMGGILLVHGLSDSPYHLRAIGKLFADNGYYVIGLRLPGHGTVPGALLNVQWEDWYDAVKFGAQMVQSEISSLADKRFYVGGFSTGGALTLRYVLQSLSDTTALIPDQLLLLSPAIGVHPLAEASDWHKLTSWMFEEFKWFEIKPEYDPFKYNSFPKNAIDQIFELTIANRKLMDKLAKKTGVLEKMPPIYASQSCVDATVETQKLIDLFVQLAPPKSDLYLFDVNRKFEAAMPDKLSLAKIVDYEQIKSSPATVVMVTNKQMEGTPGYGNKISFRPLTKASEAKALQLEQDDALSALEWPENLFALSHVCIPIASDDYFYGDESKLGKINAKGENNVLLLGNDLHRLRYNPFYDLIEKSIMQSFVEQ